MGCSTSKSVSSPVKRTNEGWDSVLPKGFAVQMDRNLKSAEVGYIAAIISANYGTMMIKSPVKSDDVSLSKQPSCGVSHQSKVSKAVGADVFGSRVWSDSNVGGSIRKSRPELKVGVPKLGSEKKKVLGATRPREETAETINTWELMQGLEDDPELASFNAEKRLPTAPASQPAAMDQRIQALVNGDGSSAISMPVSTQLISFPGSKSSRVLSTTSIGGMAAASPRPKSLNSIRCIEDVDAHIADRSRTPEWLKSSNKIQPIRLRDDDHLSQTTNVSVPSSGNLDTISAISSREEAKSDISREHSDWSPNNLQRALSFKYIFSNDSSNGMDISGRESADSQGIQSDTTPSTGNSAECLTGSTEHDSPSFRPSPEFSGAASLKDWLPGFGLLNHSDAAQTGARRSLLGALEGCSNAAGDSSWLQCEDVARDLSNSERVHSIINKYGGNDDQLPGHLSMTNMNCHAPNRFSSDTEGSTVFDPEVLELFENASEKVSEEEWYTVTKLGSESDSLRDFLHPMKSLRRGSSNSVEGLNTTAMDDTSAAASAKRFVEAGLKDPTVSKPVGGSHSMIHTEEKEFAVKQATGEFKRASSERVAAEERIVLYSTTWQSNPKAYEDCTAVKTILLSLGTSFDERNISIHAEYEQELEMPAVVPTLRVNGRCFVGLDGILQLHRRGMLASLLREAECGENLRPKTACFCRGGKFLICPLCKGRRKLGASSCRHCSATGLVKCPSCSSS